MVSINRNEDLDLGSLVARDKIYDESPLRCKKMEAETAIIQKHFFHVEHRIEQVNRDLEDKIEQVEFNG